MLVDYSEQMLGCISPCILPNKPLHNNGLFEFNMSEPTANCNDRRAHNTTRIPDHVVEELNRLGIPIGWYSSGEIQDAILACNYDRKLIDDDEGETFKDKLILTHEEKLERERKKRRHQFHNCEEEAFTP
jgi:hypothetical protein